jgi:glycosyltransferase involved in cell wall biosynthesis
VSDRMRLKPTWNQLRAEGTSISGFVRAPQWWEHKLVPIMSVFYATALTQHASVASTWPAVVSLFLAIAPGAVYVSVINDIADRADDRVAGKTNRLTGKPFWLVALLVIVPISVGLLFIFLWRDTPLLVSAYLGAWAAFSLYSLPPFRLKRRGVLGIIADASGAHLFPTLVAALLSFRATGQAADPIWVTAVAVWALPIEALALATMLWRMQSILPVLLLALYAVFAVLKARLWRIAIVVVEPRERSSNIGYEYYCLLFPLGILATSAMRYPADWAILGVHLLVFHRPAIRFVTESGDLWRDLAARFRPNPGARQPEQARSDVTLLSRLFRRQSIDYELARGADGVDQSWYLEVNPDLAAAGCDPTSHYLEFGWRQGRDPSPDFSTSYYLQANEDVARTQVNPLLHYLRHGRAEGRLPREATRWHFLWKEGLLYPKTDCHPPQPCAPYGTSGRRKILFTGHEASRTGAPLILLNLMKALERLTGAELFLVLERDGPLLEEFRRVAHVIVNRNGALYTPDGAFMRGLLNAVPSPGPELGVCNCADSWRLMRELRSAHLPYIITLIHERLALYDEEVCKAIFLNSDRIVFPADAVKAAAVRALQQFQEAKVIPQGLLSPEFGQSDKTAARKQVRERLGLRADSKIVLSCGTRIPRKGLDLFVQLAARVRSQSTASVHFVWLGGHDESSEFMQYVQHDLTVLDLHSTVSLVPAETNPECYFLAADAYVLTSRDDPFPCVVHEAMACALPVVVFNGAGGASEALADGCGIVVTYLDVESMARSVSAILEHPAEFAAMGEKAERRVRSAYSFSDYARRILDVCNEVRAGASTH